MRKFASAALAASALAVLSGCQGAHPPGYTDIFGKWAMQFEAEPVQTEARSFAGKVQGGAYNEALYTETMEHADFEYDDMQDWRDSMFHARNAITVGQGGTYQPTNLGDWRLPADKVGELTSARERLSGALAGGAPSRNPTASARALAKFNCWVEQQEENFQAGDIAYCRDEFYKALEQIDGGTGVARSEFPEAVAFSADVFFEFDRAVLRSDARTVLDDVARQLVEDTGVQVLVWGFTDRSGSERYNQGLSERRANAVAGYLAGKGVSRNRMSVQGFGETRLAVDTSDGVREARNRRVEIRRR